MFFLNSLDLCQILLQLRDYGLSGTLWIEFVQNRLCKVVHYLVNLYHVVVAKFLFYYHQIKRFITGFWGFVVLGFWVRLSGNSIVLRVLCFSDSIKVIENFTPFGLWIQFFSFLIL